MRSGTGILIETNLRCDAAIPSQVRNHASRFHRFNTFLLDLLRIWNSKSLQAFHSRRTVEENWVGAAALLLTDFMDEVRQASSTNRRGMYAAQGGRGVLNLNRFAGVCVYTTLSTSLHAYGSHHRSREVKFVFGIAKLTNPKSVCEDAILFPTVVQCLNKKKDFYELRRMLRMLPL